MFAAKFTCEVALLIWAIALEDVGSARWAMLRSVMFLGKSQQACLSSMLELGGQPSAELFSEDLSSYDLTY